MIIILLRYLKSIEELEKYVVPHRAFLDECYKKDLLVASGPQIPRSGGVIIANHTNREFIKKLFEQDPFYIYGLAEYQFIEFNPIKFHKDIEKLINTKQ